MLCSLSILFYIIIVIAKIARDKLQNMKTLTLFLILLIISSSYISFSQVKSDSPRAISNNVIVRMQKNEDPSKVIHLLPPSFEIEIDEVLSQHSDIWLLSFNDENTSLDEVIKSLLRLNTVLFAQANREVELRAAPNDIHYNNQWQHDNIDSELAWDITTGGTTANGHEIVIALIESADLMNHPDLKDNHWVNKAEIPGNGIDDDGNGYIDDYNGWNVSTNDDNIGTGSHGTSCAGMIGAKGNNGIGVSGINWDVKIMNIAGYNNPFTESGIIASYNYALKARLLWNQTNGEKGAFVVATNASWGVDGGDPKDYPIWCSFYDDLGEAGILNTGATTNQNSNVDINGDVPSGCSSDYMIGVTATNESDIIDFAGYGNQTINVAAPGSGIFTTAANGSYTQTQGTSFASPLTAGLIGLMYSIPCSSLDLLALHDPRGTADRVLDALYKGVDQSPYLIARTVSGGRINAKNSIDLLMADICSICSPPLNLRTTSVNKYDATIAFDTETHINSYTLSIQIAGTDNWTDHAVTNGIYTITGLTTCTGYEYFITSTCTNEISLPTFTQSFTTAGCGNCIDLNYCETKANNPPVDLYLNSPTSIAGSYTYYPTPHFGSAVDNGYVYGELILVDDGTSNPNEGCNDLLNASQLDGNIAIAYRGSCGFTDKAINAQDAGATAIIIINNVGEPLTIMGGTNPNITIPAIMISHDNGNILINSILNNETPRALLGKQNEWIESFEINGSIISTGNNNGYYLNNDPIQLITEQDYSFTLTPGYEAQELEEYTRIWVDLNQDGHFDSTELLYDQGSAEFGPVNDMIRIPNTAILGSTRMRVQMAYHGSNDSTLPNVCGEFIAGEVEDFCIELTSGVSCFMTIDKSIVDPTCKGTDNGEITVEVINGSPEYSFLWNTGDTTSSIQNLGPNNYKLVITDINGCDTTLSFRLDYTKELLITDSIVPISCAEINDASISVSATGGDNITYSWQNGPNTTNWTNLGSGNYKVTATDILGCYVSATYYIGIPYATRLDAKFSAIHSNLSIDFTNSSRNVNNYHWDFGDGHTATNQSPTHVYETAGVYMVCLNMDTHCDTVSYCKEITVEESLTGLNNKEDLIQINIYPNPAKELIHIGKPTNSREEIVVFNSYGQRIKHVQLSKKETSINVNDLKTGLYFFHFYNETKELTSTHRIVIIP